MKKVSAGYPEDSESQKHLSFIIFGGQYTPMEKIDLHMHSMFSDGTDTPEEIVLKTRKAVIAHLGEYHLGGARLRGFFDYCIEHEIDGFELLHPHNNPKTVGRILDFAERFRRETGRVLLLTAGSDYHGKNKAVLPAMPWML